jgi:hypothetical protein
MKLLPGLLGVLFFVGCDRGPTVYPVSGTVKFPDGRPLAQGWVEFRPGEAQPAHNARGQIRSDGSFQLTTFEPNDGALPGRHRALLVPPEPTGPVEVGEGGAFPQVIDRRFRSFQSSGLEFTVSPDEANNHVESVVQPPGK